MLDLIKGWLSGVFTYLTTKLLSNDWMTNDDIKGKTAHALAGYGVMLTAGYLKKGLLVHLIVWFLLFVYTVVKEFWYDAKYEVPLQTLEGSLTDFKWYHVGAAVGMAVITLL
jgi:hypothetical protein